MAKIAVIGTGISGLSAAYFLNARHDITVYEKASRIGGHSRTLTVQHGDRAIAVDTGFIVFNERNYPNLTQLFRQLGVTTIKSDMSFGLTARNGWLEWGANNLDSMFGQRRNLLRPGFLKLLVEVIRFNRNAVAALKTDPGITLGDMIRDMGLSDAFRQYYLLPMAGAIWSCPPRQMLEFPAETFIRFFDNHGLLDFKGQPQWYTVSGGAQRYVEKLSATFAPRIHTDCVVSGVTRSVGGVQVRDVSGHCETYDEVVFASHADETLAMLDDPTYSERQALGAFSYQRNVAILHKDPMFMPKRKACWASWVYHSDGKGDEAAITVTYWMNRLQSIDERYPLFVTLNPSRDIPPDQVFDRHEFYHPVFDTAAMAAQRQLKSLQGSNNTWFCGAHMRNGFHEDGLVSAMDVAAALGAPARWQEQEVVTLARGGRPRGIPMPVAAE